MYNSIKRSFSYLGVFLITFALSCQDSSDDNQQVEKDEQMENAESLATDFIKQNDARYSGKLAVTVLKYRDGKVYYATNTDNVRGYLELNEETITADVAPGGWVFWFGASGISGLEGIIFDEDSQTRLGDDTQEVLRGKMWCVQIPEDGDYSNDELKYDILYSTKENRDEIIRLDPKLKVNQTD